MLICISLFYARSTYIYSKLKSSRNIAAAVVNKYLFFPRIIKKNINRTEYAIQQVNESNDKANKIFFIFN